MTIQRYDRQARERRSEQARERIRQRRVATARRRLIRAMFIVFFAALVIFSVVRWVLPSEEGPIDIGTPSPAPSASTANSPAPSASAGPAASTAPSAAPSAAPSVSKTPTQKTDTSFTSEDLSITIEKKTYTSGRGETVYFVADVVCKDPGKYFKSALSGEGGKLSRTYEATSELAKRYNAAIAINCDNAAYLTDGIIVRSGVLYRYKPVKGRELLMIYADGTMKTVQETSLSSQDAVAQEIAAGLQNTFSFGPHLVSGGKPRGDYSDSMVQTYNPRTAVGMVEVGHYKLIVVDGRTDYNTGVRLIELEDICVKEGCTEAYNLDGGQSSTMVFDGKVVNDIAGRDTERGITDIIYFPFPEE